MDNQIIMTWYSLVWAAAHSGVRMVRPPTIVLIVPYFRPRDLISGFPSLTPLPPKSSSRTHVASSTKLPLLLPHVIQLRSSRPPRESPNILR